MDSLQFLPLFWRPVLVLKFSIYHSQLLGQNFPNVNNFAPTSELNGTGGSNGKAFGYGLDGPGSIPGVGGVEIFLHSLVSTPVLWSTQHPIK